MAEERRRDDPAAQWNRERRPRGRKDTRHWCRGKVGVEHVPEITRQSWARARPCREGRGWAWYRGQRTSLEWTCWHQRSCATCGKIIEPFLDPAECPDLPTGLTPTAILPTVVDP